MTFGQRIRGATGRAMAAAVACLFALQVLLAGALSAQMSVAEALGPFTICVSSGEAPPPQDHTPAPHHHDDCPICAFSALTPLAPLIAVLLTPPTEKGDVAATPKGPVVLVARPSDPRSSRGPPILI